jgi:hypothetical protein
MQKYTDFLRKKSVFFLVPSLIGIVYLGSTVLSSSTKNNKVIVRVNNLTSSCEVLNARIHHGQIEASLRNNSDKAITAYVFTSNTDPQTVEKFEEEFAYSEGDMVIAPGSIHNKVIGISSNPNHGQEVSINLSAIMLEDKSSEGDPNIIREIENHRLGEKVQLMRVLPILDRLLSISNAEMVSYFNKTAPHDFAAALNAPATELLMQLRKERIQSSNNEEPSKLTEGVELGLQHGRESVLWKYQELKERTEKQGPSSLRDSIGDLKHLYEKIIPRL